VSRHTYELGDLEPPLFTQLRDAVAASRRSVTRLDVDDDRQAITIDTDDGETQRYIDAFVDDMRRTQRRLRRKVLWETEAPAAPRGAVEAALDASGDLLPLGAGLQGLRGATLQAFRFFEGQFLALARRYGADEHHYPVMLPMEVLAELQYLTHFPNQVTFCSHLPEELPVLEAVAREAPAHGFRLAPGIPLAAPECVLQPAVCLPCYRQYRDTVLPAATSFAVTMQNHVFRFEGDNFRSLRRLWDFSVRDVVFFGPHDTLAARRQAVMEESMALCRALGLGGRMQLANDPFFVSSSRDKRVYQRMGEVKYELIIPSGPGAEELAVSSFNLHRTFYTGIYRITFADGAPAESACMGFGLERWVYAFLHQHGGDPSGWPAAVRDHGVT
jgi:seryl-tRNA synthetase